MQQERRAQKYFLVSYFIFDRSEKALIHCRQEKTGRNRLYQNNGMGKSSAGGPKIVCVSVKHSAIQVGSNASHFDASFVEET